MSKNCQLYSSVYKSGVLKENPKQKVRYHLDTEGNPKEVYLVPNVTKEIQDNTTETIKISIDRKDKDKLQKMINKILKRHGKSELSYEQIEKQVIEKNISTPSIEMQLTMDVLQYKRAILKIAYELAHYWLGENYFDDPIGEIIRTCILDDNLSEDFSSSYPIKGSIDLVGEQLEFNFMDEEDKNHIAFMMKDGNQINCYVRIFSIFEGIIQISEDANKYSNFEGMFVSINPISGVIKQTTYLEQMTRIQSRRRHPNK